MRPQVWEWLEDALLQGRVCLGMAMLAVIRVWGKVVVERIR